MSSIAPNHNGLTPPWLDLVRRKVESLGYGEVSIVVHDSQVTQIERIERTRLPAARPVATRADTAQTP